jgi:single-stranded DNA-binding protein
MNQITIVGDLTIEPHIQYTREGIATTTLTVSVEQVEGDSTTVTVICHGELAENVCLSLLVNGARIVASGRIVQRNRLVTPDGTSRRSTFALLADEVAASMCFATVDIFKVRRVGVQS